MDEKKIKYQVTTGVILIIIGITLLLLNFISEKREKVFSDMNLALSDNIIDEKSKLTEKIVEKPEEIVDNTISEEKEEVEYVYEPYIGQLEIPSIDLYKGFYSKDSSLNNVKINLYLMPTSNYPDKERGNVVIAGHSGNYSNSYFRNLYKLSEGEKINIYYNNVEYIYEIKKIYTQNKTGTINIYRDLEKSCLTLITCTENDESKQTVYIAELIEKK